MDKIEANLKLKVLRDIGSEEGKNSTVKLVYDEQLDSEFAVKIVSKELLVKDFGNDDENLFFQEARILYQNQHPNIVKIQHASSCEENIYFTMPYYKNGSLNLLMNSRFLTVREIIKCSLEFLSGIHYIHTNGLVHLDIKPTNILFNDNKKAMITDFGLSKYTDNYGIARFTKLYTSHFPPECIRNDANIATKAADIYQAGLTIYRMCNGNNHFKHQFEVYDAMGKPELANKIKSGKFPQRDFFLPHIPKKLCRVVKKSLQVDPDDRYDTILDIMNDISKIDKNLDIRHYEQSDKYIWEIDKSEKSYQRIELILDELKIYAKTINRETKTERNIAKINNSGYYNIKQAFKAIKDHINN